jgi:hypothetical protein
MNGGEWWSWAAGECSRYWWLDFARAEHPRFYQPRDTGAAATVCPYNCTAALGKAIPSKTNPNSTQCGIVQKQWSVEIMPLNTPMLSRLFCV